MSGKQKLSETVYESISSMMAAYAGEAVRVAWNDHRQRLDGSAASIEMLERILDGQSAEDLEFQTRLWGGYFGEVLRTRFGGEWEFTQYPGAEFAVPTLLVDGSRLYPLLKIYRRLTVGQTENLRVFYDMVASRMGKKKTG